MGQGSPFISIIMPTHRRSQLIDRALSSVLGQSFQDFELIVVDDNGSGSEEQLATQKVVESKCDDRIHYMVNEFSLGGSEARNVGIRSARGEWIGFLDDDEDWLPVKLERQVSLIRAVSHEVGAIDTGFIDWKKDGSVKEVQPKLQGWIFERLLRKTGGRAPKLSTLLCRADVLEKVGLFDPELPAREDYDLYLRIARHYRFESVFEPLANKRCDASERLTGDISNFVKGYEGVYRKFGEDLRARPKIHAIYLLKYAQVLALAGFRSKARCLYVQSFRLWFWNPRLLTYAPKVFLAHSKENKETSGSDNQNN